MTGGRRIVSDAGAGGNEAARRSVVHRVVVEHERERTLLPDVWSDSDSERVRTVDREVPVRKDVRPSAAAVASETSQEPRDRSGAGRTGVEVGVEVERLFATLRLPLRVPPRRTLAIRLALRVALLTGKRAGTLAGPYEPEGFSRAHAVESILGSLPDALLVRRPGRRQRPAVRRRLFGVCQDGDVLAERNQVVPVHRRGGVVKKLDVSPAVRVARGDRARLRSLRRVAPDDDAGPPPVPLDAAPHVRRRLGPVWREQRHHPRGLTRVGKRVRVELGRAEPRRPGGTPRWEDAFSADPVDDPVTFPARETFASCDAAFFDLSAPPPAAVAGARTAFAASSSPGRIHSMRSAASNTSRGGARSPSTS